MAFPSNGVWVPPPVYADAFAKQLVRIAIACHICARSERVPGMHPARTACAKTRRAHARRLPATASLCCALPAPLKHRGYAPG